MHWGKSKVYEVNIMHPDLQRKRDGKRYLSDEIIFVLDNERWNGSPLFIQYKSMFYWWWHVIMSSNICWFACLCQRQRSKKYHFRICSKVEGTSFGTSSKVKGITIFHSLRLSRHLLLTLSFLLIGSFEYRDWRSQGFSDAQLWTNEIFQAE
jgi:hypothetical protein